MSSGHGLRSGGYALRSKGSSPIQHPILDPPKPRSGGRSSSSRKKIKRNFEDIDKASSSHEETQATKPEKSEASKPGKSDATSEQEQSEIKEIGEASSSHEKSIVVTEHEKSVAVEAEAVKPEIDIHSDAYFLQRFRRPPLKPSRTCLKALDRFNPPSPKKKTEHITVTDPDLPVWFVKDETMKELARNLATEAISYMRKEKNSNWELVKPCPYEGDSISTCFLLHVNFQARSLDFPELPVQTFFAQVRHHVNGVLFVVDCCVRLGASDSMPKTRDNKVCVFCPYFVHHPPYGLGGYNTGWPDWNAIDESSDDDEPAPRKE